MELKTFVKSTISQIAEAVEELNEEYSDKACINVPTAKNERDGKAITVFEFNIALSVNDKAGAEGKVGVFSGMLGIATSGNTEKVNAAVSTVAFTIYAVLPQGKISKE